ncbi:MAG: hypothetical protein OCD76_22530 [Reichenbachiella sp.]
MNLPIIENQIALKVHNLSSDQQINIMKYVNTLSEAAVRQKENYRVNALREIRKALKTV